MGNENLIVIICGLFLIILLIISADRKRKQGGGRPEQKPQEWVPLEEQEIAGKFGETVLRRRIQSVLREDDRLFVNVSIEYDGSPTELDSVIVNRYGVFIIEAKNYRGRLSGTEEDFEWVKTKTTDAGNVYERKVKNPIRQVRRQVYLLARYLHYYGIDVWVRGYAVLIEGNSPVKSEVLLDSPAEIDRAIHTADRRMLDKKTVDKITELLS